MDKVKITKAAMIIMAASYSVSLFTAAGVVVWASIRQGALFLPFPLWFSLLFTGLLVVGALKRNRAAFIRRR
jgi:uncharacterized membrane protein